MNDHPERLLAELVDGTLSPSDRTAVEAHAAGCERCREEIALAREARGSLSSLPDLAPPAGIPLAVRREERTAPRRSWRAVGIAAVAAGVIAAGVVAVSVLGNGDRPAFRQGAGQSREEPAAEGGGGAGTAPEAAEAAGDLSRLGVTPIYRETGRRYDQESLPRLGRRFRAEAGDALEQGFPPTATEFFGAFDISELGPEAREAYRCVLAEVPPEQPVAPFAVEGAAFEGAPAYVAAFLEGPAPDQPFSRVVIWVVDRESCGLLSLASQQLE